MPPPKRPGQPPPDPDDQGPSTIHVRMGPDGKLEDPADAPSGTVAFTNRPARGQPPPAQSAPKKGLQVQLPDDEPPPPPPPKKVEKAPEPKGKGRRGAWWDEKDAQEEEELKQKDDSGPRTAMISAEEMEAAQEPEPPPEDEQAGSTVMFKRREVEPEPEPEPPPPPRRRRPAPPPEPEVYQPAPAPDYQGDVGKPSLLRTWVKRIAVLGVVFTILTAAGLTALYFYLLRSLPKIESLADYKPFVSTHVVASDGTVIGQFYQERRTVVPLEKMPKHLVQAVISSEDKDFYKHPGFSVIALVRAAIVDMLSGRKRLGASTITQQVVKTFFLTKEKRFSRKLKEILLSLKLERDLSKDDILHLYLNQINFGKAHYGVQEASLYYFNKAVQDIDLGEAALLAGLPQNPSRLNPRFHPANAKRRQTYVLDRMLANKYIQQEDRDREVERPIALPPPPQERAGQWYLEEVKRRLVDQYGEAAVNTAGMTVEVAMVPALQRAAEHAVAEGLRAIDKRQGFRGAEFNAGDLEPTRSSLARRHAAMAPTPGAVMVFDLGGIPEKEQSAPERIARAARLRPLEHGLVYAGLVTAVGGHDAHVELAPGVVGTVPFSTMGWARPFKPSGPTPPPRTPQQILKRGDVVQVRVTRLVTQRVSAVKLRVRALDLGLEQTPLVQGAFVAIDLRTRGVSALVGGYDFAFSQFNRATQAKRQPGSAFKPILYATAIDSARYTPATRVDDSPTPIVDPWTGKTWNPQNFERDVFAGSLPLRKALAESKNTVAVKLLLDLGFDKVRTMAKSLGLSTEVPKSYAAALGAGEVIPIELVNAYATLASLGRKSDPVLIRKVRSRANAIMQSTEAQPEPSIKPEVAYVTADMMRAVIEDPEGTARSLGILMRPIAGKTGTTSDHKDAWFIGFTPSLVAGAWTGFDDSRLMGPHETGGHAAGPMWLSFMKAALAGKPIEDWPPIPPGVTMVKVNRNTGAPAADNDPYALREVFLAGTEPAAASPAADQTQFLKE